MIKEVSEMRVNGISSAYQSQAAQRVQYENQYGSVSKVNTASQSDTSKDERNANPQITTDENQFHKKQNILPTNEVVDFAINKDMNADKDLIGSTSKLDTLDIQKAISD